MKGLAISQNSKYNQWSLNITYLRRASGWWDRNQEYSQREFAIIFDVTHRTIALWESGQTPSTPQLNRLAKFFTDKFGIEITPDDLLNTDLRNLIQVRPLPKDYMSLPEEKRKIFQRIEGLFLRRSSINSMQDLEMIADVIEKLLNKREGENSNGSH